MVLGEGWHVVARRAEHNYHLVCHGVGVEIVGADVASRSEVGVVGRVHAWGSLLNVSETTQKDENSTYLNLVAFGTSEVLAHPLACTSSAPADDPVVSLDGSSLALQAEDCWDSRRCQGLQAYVLGIEDMLVQELESTFASEVGRAFP